MTAAKTGDEMHASERAALRRSLPYRNCAGALVVNDRGEIWIGKRVKANVVTGSETLWQMPQGGIDEGEDATRAALRELYEETSMRSVEVVRTSDDWFVYDLPDELLGIAWKGRYRGQRIRWTLCRFVGDEREINVTAPGGGRYKAEFSTWRWCPIDDLMPLVVPFKRDMYRAVFAHFAPELRPLIAAGSRD